MVSAAAGTGSAGTGSAGTGSAADLVCPYRLFNTKLTEFIADLQPLIGHLPEYAILSKTTMVLATFNGRGNQEVFDTYVAKPYEDRIIASDESFFLTSSYDQFNSAGFVQLLKSVWGSVSDSDKTAIWNHLKVLIVLNRRCCQSRNAQ